MDESQSLRSDEDVGSYEVICRVTGGVFTQARDAAGELELAVIAEDGDRSRQLARRRAKHGQPMQDKASHGGGSDGLHSARGLSRRDDCRRLKGPEQLTQEQRVATGRGMTCPTEAIVRLRA